MNLILQNFLLQISSLFIGILGGITLAHLAQEELSLYKKQLTLLFPILSFATLFSPCFFFLSDLKKIIPFVVLFFIAAALFWRTKGKREDFIQGFFYIAALTFFLSSSDSLGFFLALLFFVLTIIVLILSLFCSEKMHFLQTSTLLCKEFFGFLLITVLLYSMTFFFSFL